MPSCTGSSTRLRAPSLIYLSPPPQALL
ncbi:hypothetical protein E2C01_054076 [Portunus trituberculatus]|uniref:Uncharacterized protein n=1 Tax=Portunus trituberculatus TaxID=210409 RepID=A0A5B7GIX2_PORTR|nr:hypothetical protein [Portunus trituberculatus]